MLWQIGSSNTLDICPHVLTWTLHLAKTVCSEELMTMSLTVLELQKITVAGFKLQWWLNKSWILSSTIPTVEVLWFQKYFFQERQWNRSATALVVTEEIALCSLYLFPRTALPQPCLIAFAWLPLEPKLKNLPNLLAVLVVPVVPSSQYLQMHYYQLSRHLQEG